MHARNESEPVSAREMLFERTIKAPARLVYTAYTTAEHLKAWFGPKPYPVTHAEIDFRVGGKWRMRMTAPDGSLHPWFGGEYLEIVPNQKIVWTSGFEESPQDRMTWTMTFEQQGEHTKLKVHTLFNSVRMKEEHTKMGYAEGSNLALDQLEAHIRSMA